MNIRTTGLGTKLRLLIELLDGSVDALYREQGLDYRARYTPVMRALSDSDSLSIKDVAVVGRMSHAAASQTVTIMTTRGLVSAERGDDGRERYIALTPKGWEMLLKLRPLWAAVDMAAASLDADIGTSLGNVIEKAIDALDRQGFSSRIHQHLKREEHV